MRFDLTDLRLFLNIVEAESITHGAERAALALASASARVRGMEDQSGVALLDRTPRGVRPTPAGQALAHHARMVLAQLEQMRGDLRQYAHGLRGHVRMLSNTAALTHLPHLLGGFLAAHPTIDIDLEERMSRDIVVAVATGLADFGIAADTAELSPLETRHFRNDRLVLVVAAGHPLADRETVALRDVLHEPFVGLGHGSALQTHLALHAAREGQPFKLRVRLTGVEAVGAMVAKGVGIAIVPEAAFNECKTTEALASVALTDTWAVRKLMICARNFSALPAHARALVEHFTEAG
jgi:DNA-binding transcriptional LysR family regulator